MGTPIKVEYHWQPENKWREANAPEHKQVVRLYDPNGWEKHLTVTDALFLVQELMDVLIHIEHDRES